MSRTIAFVFVCLFGGSTLAGVVDACPQTAPVPVNQDWLRSDEKRIAQVRDAFGRAELTVELLREIAGSSDVREDRVIGFGARRVRLALYGGYTTIWMNLLAEEPDEHGRSRVVALELEQRGSAESWAAVAPTLHKAWAGSPAASALGERESAITYERRDAARLAALRAKIEKALGAVSAAEVPSGLARAFGRLTSPHEELVIGRSCFSDGGPPPGAEDIRALAAAGRHDLVRSVLRGFNPEGRVWAVHALLEHARTGGVLDEADKRAIDVLRALPLKLACCDGCELEYVSFDEALRRAAK